MPSVTYPIVGAYYRPPAKAFLDHLPISARLILQADPYGDNTGQIHNDPNAIAVWLPADSIPESEELSSALAGYGTDYENIKACAVWHVGYLPKESAAYLRTHGFPDGDTVEGEFTCGTNGSPRVRFESFP